MKLYMTSFHPLISTSVVCGYAMATNLEHGAALIFYILSLVTNLVGTSTSPFPSLSTLSVCHCIV